MTIITSPVHATPVTNGLQLWVDASNGTSITADGNGKVSQWNDLSGNNNHLTQGTYSSQAKTGINTLNSKNVIFFENDNEFYSFTDINDIRSVFWVMKDDATGSTDNQLLGHSSSGDFRRDSFEFFDQASTSVRSGKLKLNSEIKDPDEDNVPVNEPFYLSLVTTSNNSANQLARYYTSSNRAWHGDIAEVLIYNKSLSNGEVIQVEDYLASKWGLVDNGFIMEEKFPPDNGALLNQVDKLRLRFSRAVDTQSANIEIFYSNGSLVEAIDMSSASVTGNGSQFIEINLSSQLNANNSYYVRINPSAIDDLSATSFPGITDNGSWSFSVPSNPMPVDNGLRLWMDAADNGLIISDVNGKVSKIFDKSLSFNHLNQSSASSQPSTGVNSLNSQNVIFFDNDNELLNFYDISQIRTVFWVAKDDATGGTDNQLLGHNASGDFRRDSFEFFDQAATSVRNGKLKLNSEFKDPDGDNVPVNQPFYVSLVSTGNVQANQLARYYTSSNRTWHGDIAEVLIFDKALSNGEVIAVEDYLATKWGFVSNGFSIEERFPPDNGALLNQADKLKLKFSRSVDTQTGNLDIFYSNGSLFESITMNSVSVTGNGSRLLEVNLSSQLNANNSYYVRIAADAIDDLTGNSFAGITDNGSWSFTVPNNPMPVDNGLRLWMDAADNGLIISDVNGKISKIFDKSLSFNHLNQSSASNQPSTGVNTLNSQNVIFFDNDNEFFNFDDINNIRTVFWVMKDDATGGVDNQLLGHNASGDFRRDSSEFFDQASTSIRNGKLKLNSEFKDPDGDNVPVNQPFYLSLLSTGNVKANQLARYYTSGTRTWHGDIAEVLIFDKALSNGEVIAVEDYLATKWGFVSNGFSIEERFPPDNGALLNQADKLKLKFSRSVDTQTGNLDIFYSNGSLFESITMNSVSVTGNGSRLIEVNLSSQLNTNNSYYVRINPSAIDDLTGNSFAGITDNGSWSFSVPSNPMPVDNGLRLWMDAADNGLIISDVNGKVSKIFDKSLNFNHLTQSSTSNQPSTGVNTLNSQNVIFFDNDNELLNFYDIGNIRTIFWVMEDDATGGVDNQLLGHNASGDFRRDSNEFFDQSSTNIRNGKLKLNSQTKDPDGDNVPTNEPFYLSLITTGNVEANQLARYYTSGTRTWHGDIAEVLIFDKTLSNGELAQVEDYLGEKWGRKLNRSFSPADNSTNISLDSNLSISFPENADQLNGSLAIYRANGSLLENIDLNSAQITGNGTTSISINPATNLPAQENVYINITPGSFTDIANGNKGFAGFFDNNTWNFTTAAFNKDWTTSNKITIKATEINGDLTEFPVYINLAHMPASFFTKVKSNGADIRITKANKIDQLPFELVEINTNNGSGELWFKADSLSSSTDTDFYIWYGNNGASAYAASDTYGSQNTWSNGYVGVWHLGEDGNTNDNGYADSTSYANHGNGVSMTAASDVTGKLAKAQDFDGSVDEIAVPDKDILDMNGNSFTISSWIKTSDAGQATMASKGTWETGNYQYRTTSGQITWWVNGFSPTNASGATTVNDNTWHYAVMVYSPTTVLLYADSLQDQSTSVTDSLGANTSNFYIGSRSGAEFFDGAIDELHLSNVARSANWISAEYNNQNSPSTFYEIEQDTAGLFNWNLF